MSDTATDYTDRNGVEHDNTCRHEWPIFCHGPRWFRIKGYGLRIVDHRDHKPLFSERYGYKRVWHVGPFCVTSVKP